MNPFSKTIYTLFLFSALGLSTYAQDISQTELQAFAAQKFRVDYNAQTQQAKAEIMNEFTHNAKLGDTLLSGAMKDDIDFKIASRQIAIEIWAQKFLASAQIDEATIKAMYDKFQPKTIVAYKLRNILVNSEDKAQSLIKTLSKIKEPKKQLSKFKELVKSDSQDLQTRKNEGSVEWIDLDKLSPAVQTSLKDKKVNDLVKIEVENIGWQVLLIEEIKPEHKASYEEAAPQLSMIAKQELLNQEIKKILDIK